MLSKTNMEVFVIRHCIELTCKRISYEVITRVYGNACMMVVQVILRLEITKSSYIDTVML
jgi:hypothetical protein